MEIAKGQEMVSLLIRHSYSHHHLAAAVRFADLAATIEGTRAPLSGTTSVLSSDVDDHRHFVIASIMCTGACVDTAINEVYADADDHRRRFWRRLSTAALDRLKAMRAHLGSQVLRKYELALILADRPPWDPKDPLYRDVKTFTELRNQLVHYTPEWGSGGAESHTGTSAQRFRALLRGRFPLNPFTASGNAFFPDQCFSVGCLRWCFQATLAFMDEFFRRMRMRVPYARARPN